MSGQQFDAPTRDLLASLRDQLGDAPSPTVYRTLLGDVEAMAVQRDWFRRLLITAGRNLRIFGPEGEGTFDAIPDAAAEARQAGDVLGEQLERAEAERDECRRITLAVADVLRLDRGIALDEIPGIVSALAVIRDELEADRDRLDGIRRELQRENDGLRNDNGSLRRGNAAYANENGDLRRRHDELVAAHNATVAHRRAVQLANADLRDEVNQLRAASRADAHRRHDLVFNGISRALGEQQVFVPLPVRERCAEAALAALDANHDWYPDRDQLCVTCHLPDGKCPVSPMTPPLGTRDDPNRIDHAYWNRRAMISDAARIALAKHGYEVPVPPMDRAAEAVMAALDAEPASPREPVDLAPLLASIDNALRNGSYMTGANLAFGRLCDRLGVDRDGLEFRPDWAQRQAARDEIDARVDPTHAGFVKGVYDTAIVAEPAENKLALRKRITAAVEERILEAWPYQEPAFMAQVAAEAAFAAVETIHPETNG
ncbi:hypothetical protein C1I95_24705 [Micromonospora craterilacus]|uniref:Uncharacterized protein n=1 Tax=Micromonospora craterilacus TaxID=1655439 RepID=A0A2W2EUB5_9ACTN|nr:hypothetical protein [Micromonospora craterilacus]PZG12947.1 hypothetical protein C1I95_24705 [Micromonospora craterilacus]